MSFERHDVVVTYSIVDANSSKSIEAFGQRLNQVQDRLNKFHDRIGRVSKRSEDAGRKLTMVERGFKAFNKTIGNSNMKLFGLYFALGRISQGMWGLLQPAMDAYGIFDYWQIMLTDLFIPVIDDMYGAFDALMGVIMGLPEPVKKFIGYFVLITAAATSVVAALVGVKLAMWALGTAAVGVGTALAVIGGAALIAGFAVVVGWILKMKDEMGGWGEFTKSVIRGIVRVFGLLAHVGIVIFGNMIAWVGDKMAGLVSWIAKLASVIPGAGGIADKLNSATASWASLSSAMKQGAIFGNGMTAPEYLEKMMNGSFLAANSPAVSSAASDSPYSPTTQGASVVAGMQSAGMSNADIINQIAGMRGDGSINVNSTYIINSNDPNSFKDSLRRAQDDALLGLQRSSGGLGYG
jgi:hypothetical protein